MWSSFLNVIIFSSIQSSLSLWDLFSWPYQGHFRTRTFNLKQVIFKKGDTNEMNSIASSPSWLCAPVEKVPKACVLFVHPCSSSWNFHSHFERSEDREFYSFNIVGGIFFCLASETLFHILTTSGIWGFKIFTNSKLMYLWRNYPQIAIFPICMSKRRYTPISLAGLIKIIKYDSDHAKMESYPINPLGSIQHLIRGGT